MNSYASSRFWSLFFSLPPDVQELAIKNYKLWLRDPHHPSLRFRRLQGSDCRYTVRVGDHYRALGQLLDANSILWVWIGTHAEYDRLTGS